MTIRISSLHAAALLILFSACASPTPYKEASDNGTGYQSLKLDDNKFRVSFQGNQKTSRETVETYLFYRAAELTLHNGFEYFRVVQFSTEKDTEDQIIPATSASGLYPFPYYTYGYAWSPTQIHRQRQREYEAQAYITMLNTKPKADDGSVFSATNVISNLKSKIVKPD